MELADGMKMVEKQSKKLFKLLLLSAKVIPMLIAFIHLINLILAYFNIDCAFLSYLGGISILSIAFQYIASYALHFCEYHRMFIHYSLAIDCINTYDEYIGIPLNNEHYFIMLLIITIITLFLILYFKRCRK